jgi:KTSC domain-containing protein
MERVYLESSLLTWVEYNPQTRVLDVEFRTGELYRYFAVPIRSYDGLLEAESKGRYFNKHIRNRFSYRHLSRPAAPVVLRPSP